MSQYLLHGKLTAKLGHKDELAKLMLEASMLMAKAKGCILYIVGLGKNDVNSVYITEIWETEQDHDESLNYSGVRELIKKVMPILEEMPKKGQEINILGGKGV